MSISHHFANYNTEQMIEFSRRISNTSYSDKSNEERKEFMEEIFNIATIRNQSVNSQHKYYMWKQELYNLYNCYEDKKQYSGNIYSIDYPQIFKDLFKSLETILFMDNKQFNEATRFESVKQMYHFLFSHLLLGYEEDVHMRHLYNIVGYGKYNNWYKSRISYIIVSGRKTFYKFNRYLDDLITSENNRLQFEELRQSVSFLTTENKKLKSQLSLLQNYMHNSNGCSNTAFPVYDYEAIKNRNKSLHRELKTMFRLFRSNRNVMCSELECIPFARIV